MNLKKKKMNVPNISGLVFIIRLIIPIFGALGILQRQDHNAGEYRRHPLFLELRALPLSVSPTHLLHLTIWK